MSTWEALLERTFRGLEHLAERGQPVPDWVLGGGTALMLALRHRYSKDVDAFIDDPQYLGNLDPELGAEGVWGCTDSDRQANYLKLSFPEGEIDFIAAGAITDMPVARVEVAGRAVPIQHPVEIAVSKMFHRPRSLKVRDIFDIAAVNQDHAETLARNLHHLSAAKADLTARMDEIRPTYYVAEMAEIEVLSGWKALPDTAFERVREIIETIPEPRPNYG